MLTLWKDVFRQLLPTATVEMLVSMDPEPLDNHRNSSVRSAPFPANAEDRKEIVRQIY